MSGQAGVYKGLRVVPPGQDPEVYQDPERYRQARGRHPSEDLDWRTAPAGDAAVRHLILPPYDEKHRRDATPSGAKGLCVDELCSCGMHSCPPPYKSLPFEGSSTYASTYTMIEPEKRKAPVPDKVPPSLPFEGSSTYA